MRASPKGGMPGFVKILDERHLLIPDIAGNKLFQSYLNMSDNPRVGLVFFIPGCPDVARVNGKVTIVSAEEVKRPKSRPQYITPTTGRWYSRAS